MTAAAEDAFAEFVADCGPEAYQTPAACNTYLSQYLDKFPDARDLLLAGLQVGVPRHIMKHDGGVGYDDHLKQIAEKFVAAAGITPEEATWAVEAWAYGVGRPAGTEVVKASDLGRVYSGNERPKSQGVANTIITAIVVAGGVLGGLFIGFPFAIVMMAMTKASQASFAGGDGRTTEADVLTVLVLTLLIACWTGAAAWAGWWFGGGTSAPWRGFCVAFGATFSTGAILIFVLHPFIKPFVLFGATFGAVYRVAARNGRD